MTDTLRAWAAFSTFLNDVIKYLVSKDSSPVFLFNLQLLTIPIPFRFVHSFLSTNHLKSVQRKHSLFSILPWPISISHSSFCISSFLHDSSSKGLHEKNAFVISWTLSWFPSNEKRQSDCFSLHQWLLLHLSNLIVPKVLELPLFHSIFHMFLPVRTIHQVLSPIRIPCKLPYVFFHFPAVGCILNCILFCRLLR